MGGNRPSHLDGQRQPIKARTLAADDELTRTPVEVVEAQPRHLAGAKAEPQQRDQDRIVT